MIEITCKIGCEKIVKVKVNITDPIFVLLKKLNITDKATKFLYKGQHYIISSKMTFQEIDLVCDSTIFIVIKSIEGKVGMKALDASKKTIELVCKINREKIIKVKVNISDPFFILLEKLNITDKNAKFIFNHKIYILLSIMTFQEIGLLHDSTIYIITNVIAGGGVRTVDVSKNQTKLLEFENTGKKYRYTTRGLNIQSKCKNKSCEAYKDVIYIKIGYVMGWNLLENLKEKVKCPSCNERVKPLNFGFWDCLYEIEYEKETENGYEENIVRGDSGENEFRIFANENDKVDFTRLVFNIYHR